MNTMTITNGQLKAISMFASKDEARPAICTVAVHANTDPSLGLNSAFLVATDSYVIAAFAPTTYEYASDFTAALQYAKCVGSIPTAKLDAALKMKGSIVLTWEDDSWCISVTTPNTVIDMDGRYEEADFPNVRSIFPMRGQNVQPTAFFFAPSKMTKVIAAANLASDQVRVSKRGTSADRANDGKEPVTYVGAVHINGDDGKPNTDGHLRPQWFYMNDGRPDVNQCSMLMGVMPWRQEGSHSARSFNAEVSAVAAVTS